MDGWRAILKIVLIACASVLFCLFSGFSHAANTPPQVGTLTPTSGTTLPNIERAFTTTFIDPDGYTNLRYGAFLINTSINGANCFYGNYNRYENKFYLRNDDDTAWLEPDPSNIISELLRKIRLL
jgi:hypothetical protein